MRRACTEERENKTLGMKISVLQIIVSMLVIVSCSSNTVEDGKLLSCEKYSSMIYEGEVYESYLLDEIFYEDGEFKRKTNRSGGIEGGMSNGEEIVVRLAMKPIPTLMKGLQSVDFVTKEKTVAASERSDVCAVFALEIIAEAVVAKVLAEVVKKRLGGDTMSEVKMRYALLP